MTDQKPETEAEAPARKAPPKGPTYRALRGFNYPRPGGPVKVKSPGGKDITSAEIRVEAGATGLSLPEAVVKSFDGAGVIEKEQ